MILSPLDPVDLRSSIAGLADRLTTEAARAALARVAGSRGADRASGAEAVADHEDAVALAAAFGIALSPGSPAVDFSWDGNRLRTETEAYILLHEVAHYQLASPARRPLIDFGLGAGPESGARDKADAAACVFGVARESEEALASLLGILWEAELGHPALASFLDQNWLEGAHRSSAARYFEAVVEELRSAGFVDAALRPTRFLRESAEPYSLTAPVRLET